MIVIMIYEAKRTVRIKWNKENKEVVVNKSCENIDNLINMCTINDTCQENINICIEKFTNELNDLILPFCSVTTHKTNRERKGPTKVISEDKPWFNEILKKRYLQYKNAINIFNATKTNENRSELIRLKKIYKKLECKL